MGNVMSALLAIWKWNYMHREIKTNGKRSKSPVQNATKYFTTVVRLNRHMRIHNGVRYVQCCEWGKLFGQRKKRIAI